MNWLHVRLIFRRELYDQLRDRRTLFTITILPILLYPLLGLLMMQIAQFNQEYAVDIQVIGIENWPEERPLLDEDGQLIERPGFNKINQLVSVIDRPWPEGQSLEEVEREARESLARDEADSILIVMPDFQERLDLRLENAIESDPTSSPQAAQEGLRFVSNLARDHSQIAQRRMEAVLDSWRSEWVAGKLSAAGINPRLIEPLNVEHTDTAPQEVKRAMLWSKVLPFVMLVWALTGAFYPAVDLCAGEKERGTLETLLSSPARRKEIVWGKLLTVCVFSIGTALLNLMSMHLTAGIIVRKLAQAGTPQIGELLGPMPIESIGWLILLLLPMAAFFSALALAVAALARSTKEGQYYLMPLLLITLPLVALPMLPSLEMSLGTSLVPVSGAIFLVRALIEGRYAEAFFHLPVVLMVTVACCAVSIRWAIKQFESESVMFRESERWNLRVWMHQLWRDRGETASPAEAVLCGALILVAMFFAQFVAGSTLPSWTGIVTSTVTVQIGLILTPCLLMSIFLTRSARKALRIHRPQKSHLFAAILLGFALHPSYTILGQAISQIYQIGPETQAVLAEFQNMMLSQPIWAILLLLALLPAICEELAYRGFIFGGLLRSGGVLRAVIVSALFFGFMHSVLQQSIAACIMGLVLGVIAWRTGTVLCTIIVHLINNSLSLTLAWCGFHDIDLPGILVWAIKAENGSWQYQSAWLTMSIVLSAALMVVLFQQNSETEEVVHAEMAA